MDDSVILGNKNMLEPQLTNEVPLIMVSSPNIPSGQVDMQRSSLSLTLDKTYVGATSGRRYILILRSPIH